MAAGRRAAGLALCTSLLVAVMQPVEAEDQGSPPRFGGAVSFTIAEDHEDGELVGTVTASDADGDVVDYALSGDDAGLFALAASGASANLSVAAGKRLSHESATSHELTVTATDPSGLSAEVAVTVSVTDVLEPPVWGTAAPTLTNKFSTSVTVDWVSPDVTDRPPVVQFEITALELDDAGNEVVPLVIVRKFIYDGSATSGTITGLKPSTGYQVSVAAENAEGSSRSASRVFTTQRPNNDPRGYNPATCGEDSSDLTLSASAGTQVELGPLHGSSSQEGTCSGSEVGQASYFWDPDGDELSMSVSVASPPAAVWRGMIGGEQSPVIDAGGTKLQFVGMAARAATELVAVVKADDGRGGSGTRRVVITVGGFSGSAAPSFGSEIADQKYKGGEEITPLVLPAATGGDLGYGTSGDVFDYVYALSEELPEWLSFDASTRTLSGTPPADNWERHDLTYTAQDADLEQGEADTASQTFRIEVPPGVTGVGYYTDPGEDRTYAIGDAIGILLWVGGALYVEGSPLPQLAVQVGDQERLAPYSGSTGKAGFRYTLPFEYTVQEGDADADGVSIEANALRVNGAWVATQSELELAPEHGPLSFEWWEGTHLVDGVRPVVSGGPEIISTPRQGQTYGAGEVIKVKLSFSEPVTVTGTPQLELTVGGTARTAKYDGGDSEDRGVVFHYAVQFPDSDEDGVSIAADGLELNGGTISDAAGNAANDLAQAALAAQAGHKVRVLTNSAPTFAVTEATFTVAENTPPGGQVGTALTATDVEEADTLAYALSGTDGSDFAITSEGQITVGSGTELDHEEKASYALTVEVRDGRDTAGDEAPEEAADATVAVTVTVTDVDEPPPAPSGVTVSGATVSSVTVSWTAPDNTGRPAITDYDVRYRKSGSSDEWSGHAHEGTALTALLTGLQENTTYAVQVRAGNDEGEGPWSASGTGTTDAAPNAAPTAAAIGKTVDEDTELAFTAGDFTAVFSDPDAGDTLAAVQVVRLPAAGAGVLRAGAVRNGVRPVVTAGQELPLTELGTLRFVPAADWNGAASFTFKLVDSRGAVSDVATATITVQAVNDAPAFATATVAVAVDENSAAGTAVGAAVTATDPDDAALTYALGGADAARFTVDAASGQIRVGSGTELDHEGKASYALTVEARDGRDAAGDEAPEEQADATVAVTVTVADVDEPPPAPAAPAVEAGTGSTRLAVSWTGPDTAGRPPVSDYDVRYRESGSGGAWSEWEHDGTALSTTVTGLRGGTVYAVQVRAGNDEGEGPWSASGTGATNAAPTAAAIGKTVEEDTELAFTAGDFTAVFSDPDAGDTLAAVQVVRLPAAGAGVLRAGAVRNGVRPVVTAGQELPLAELGTLRFVPAADWNGAASFTFKLVDSRGAVSDVATATVTVQAVNDAPAFAAATVAVAVDENSAAGTAVGAAVTATDPDDAALTYALGGADAARFTVDAASGQIRVGGGTELDHEGKASYALTVEVRDRRDATGDKAPEEEADATVTVTVTVADVDEPPPAPSGVTVGGATVSSVTVSWTAPDTTGRPPVSDYDVRYRESGSGGAWSEWEHDGTALSTTVTGLRGGTVYAVQVRAGNDEGEGPWSASGTGATNAAPTAAAIGKTVEEDTELAFTAGDFTAVFSDPDAGDTLAAVQVVRLPAAGAGVLRAGAVRNGVRPVVTAGQELPLAELGTLRFVPAADWNGAASFTFKLVDSRGAVSDVATATVTVQAVNDAPAFATATVAVAVDENSAAGTAVGAAVTATDPDDAALTYALGGADAARFTVDAASGQIRVGSGTELDHEGKASYALTVEARDGRDAAGDEAPEEQADATVAVTVTVADVDEAPPAPAAPAVEAGTGSTRLAVSWTGPDTAGRPPVSDYDVRYRESGSGGAWSEWEHDGTALSTTVTGLRGGTVYAVQVRAGNDEGEGPWSASGTGATNAAVNAVPAFAADAVERAVDENSAAGTAVGDPVAATDADDRALTYALGGADAARFAVDATSGQIRVGSGTELDHEGKASYALTVEVRDGRDADGEAAPQEGADATVAVTVQVGDVNEPPPPPSALTVTAATATGLSLSWSAPDSSGRPPLTGYVVRYRLGGGEWKAHIHSGVTTQAMIGGLTPELAVSGAGARSQRRRHQRLDGDRGHHQSGARGEFGGHLVAGGERRRLCDRRPDRGDGDVQHRGDGDRDAAARAEHRQRDEAGGLCVRSRRRRVGVQLRGGRRRQRWRRGGDRCRRAERRRRRHSFRRGRRGAEPCGGGDRPRAHGRRRAPEHLGSAAGDLDAARGRRPLPVAGTHHRGAGLQRKGDGRHRRANPASGAERRRQRASGRL